jgi:DNA-binding NarL/FixJ family response regulator
MADTHSIIIIEDHPLMREGLASFLAVTGRWEVRGKAATLTEAKELVTYIETDIALIDIQLDDGWGLDIIPCLPGKTLTAVYSAFDDYSHVSVALGMGVKAYICKRRSEKELEDVLLKVLEGETWIDDTAQVRLNNTKNLFSLLTKREAEIMQLVKTGLSNSQIAAKLDVSRRTVENILSCVYDKTGIHSRREIERL